MEFVYVVVENGEAYPSAYTAYESAVKAVNVTHQDELNRQIDEIPDCQDEILSRVNPEEDPSGKTFLYIEKGIYIYIYRLPVAKKPDSPPPLPIHTHTSTR